MDFVADIANGLIAMSMVLVCIALWRVRKYRFLKGGEAIVLTALVFLSVDRGLIAFDIIDMFRPFILPITAALSITSSIIVSSFLPELRNRNDRHELCILDKEGRRYCHLAMMAEAMEEKSVSGTYKQLVDKVRSEKARELVQGAVNGFDA